MRGAELVLMVILASTWDIYRIKFFPWATISALPIWLLLTVLIRRLA